jgi:hypothetical protein
MSGAVDGHNTRGGKASCFSIRLVDRIVIDAFAMLESKKLAS